MGEEMTLWTIGIGISLSLLFALTNAVSYKRGFNGGFNIGVETKIEKVRKGEYLVDLEERE